jgi:hypothetical protein
VHDINGRESNEAGDNGGGKEIVAASFPRSQGDDGPTKSSSHGHRPPSPAATAWERQRWNKAQKKIGIAGSSSVHTSDVENQVTLVEFACNADDDNDDGDDDGDDNDVNNKGALMNEEGNDDDHDDLHTLLPFMGYHEVEVSIHVPYNIPPPVTSSTTTTKIKTQPIKKEQQQQPRSRHDGSLNVISDDSSLLLPPKSKRTKLNDNDDDHRSHGYCGKNSSGTTPSAPTPGIPYTHWLLKHPRILVHGWNEHIEREARTWELMKTYFNCSLQRRVDIHPNLLKNDEFRRMMEFGYTDPDVIRDPEILRAIRTGLMHQSVQLEQVTPHTASFTLRAHAMVRKHTCIGVCAGRLWDREEFEQHVGKDDMRHIWSWAIDSNAIRPTCYEGPDLVLEAVARGNELRFINDPSWDNLGVGDETANVAAYPMFYEGIPYTIILSERTIQPGEQLFLDWGVQTWDYMAKIQMKRNAYECLLQHRWCAALQRTIEQHLPSEDHILIREDYQPDIRPIAFLGEVYKASSLAATHAYRDNALLAPGSTFSVPPLPPHLAFGPVHEKDLAAAYINESQMVIQLSPSVRRQLDQHRPFSTRPGPLAGIINKLLHVHGGIHPDIRVREILELHHPARFYTSPHHAARALVAINHIAQGTPVLAYIGEMMEEPEYERRMQNKPEGCYGWEIDVASIRRFCPDYNGPSIVIDSTQRGNAARFANDKWGRREESQAVNVSVETRWDSRHNVPFILLRASRAIRPNEEIVCDYGDGFWRKVTKYTMIRQAQYLKYMEYKCSQLVQVLNENHIKVPPIPSWKTEAEFCAYTVFDNSVDYRDYREPTVLQAPRNNVYNNSTVTTTTTSTGSGGGRRSRPATPTPRSTPPATATRSPTAYKNKTDNSRSRDDDGEYDGDDVVLHRRRGNEGRQMPLRRPMPRSRVIEQVIIISSEEEEGDDDQRPDLSS